MQKITVARQPFYHKAQQPSEGHELANEMQIRMLPKLMTTHPSETLTSQSNSSPALVDGCATPYTSSRDSSEPFTNLTPAASTQPGLNPWSRFCDVPSSPDADSSGFIVEADSWGPSRSNYNAISCMSSAAQAQLDSINYTEYFPRSFHGLDPLVQLQCKIRRNNTGTDAGQLVPEFTISDVAAPALEDLAQGSSTRRLGLINSILRVESECDRELQLQPAQLQQDEGSVPHHDGGDDDGQTLDQIQLARARQFLFLDQEHHHRLAELIPSAAIFDDLGGMTKYSHGFGVSTLPGATRKSECALSSSSTGDAGEIMEDNTLHETTIKDFGSPGVGMNYMSTNATCSYTGKRKRRPDREDTVVPDSNQPAILDRIDKKTGKSRSKPRPVREPRYAIKTRTNVDIMDDGFRWRKYGQKAVRDSPYPRNYYRCTTPHCPVRKRVERTLEDPGLVLTIYEGKHSHHSSCGTAAATHQQPTNPGQQSSNLPNDYFSLPSNLGHEFRAPTAPLGPPLSLLLSQYHELQVVALQDKFNVLRAYQIFKLQQQEEFLAGFINSTKLGPLGNFPSRMLSASTLRSSRGHYPQAAPQLHVPDLAVSLGHETALHGPTVSGTLQPSVLSESLAYPPFSSAFDHARTFCTSEHDQGFQVVPGQELTQGGHGQHMTIVHNYASDEEDLLEDFRLPH